MHLIKSCFTLFLLLLLSCYFTFASDSLSTNRFIIAGESRLEMFSINNTYKDKMFNAKPINTISSEIRIEYSRNFKSGLYLGAGILFGNKKYAVSTVMNLSDFDSLSKNNLRGVTLQHDFAQTVFTLGPCFRIGYAKNLRPNLKITTSLGLAFKMLSNGPERDMDWVIVQYKRDNVSYPIPVQAYYLIKDVGSYPGPFIPHRGLIGSRNFTRMNNIVEVFLGIEKNISKALPIKGYALGLIATANAGLWKNENVVTYGYYESYSKSVENTVHIVDRSLSIGLRCMLII